MARKIHHISQRKEDKLWQVKGEGAEKATKLFKTQAEAIAYAEKVAKNRDGTISVHGKNGKIRKA